MSPKTNPALDRRTAIRVGAVGAVATTAAVATATTAEAAAGQAILAGRANSAGTAGTTLTTASSAIALTVKNTGTGASAFFFAQNNNGFAGGTGSGSKYGLSAANTGGVGAGAAMAASGGNNTGVLANTNNSDKFALEAVNLSGVGSSDGGGIYAEGGDGVGVLAITNGGAPALAAVGDAWTIDGHFFASASNGALFSAQLLAGDPQIEFSGKHELDANGKAVVALSELGVPNVDLSRNTAFAFPNSGAMPNLYALVADSTATLEIHGGTPGGTVSWRVSAVRVDAPTPWDPPTSAKRSAVTNAADARAAIAAAKDRTRKE